MLTLILYLWRFKEQVMTSDGQEIQSKKVHSTPIILDDRQLKVSKSQKVFYFFVAQVTLLGACAALVVSAVMTCAVTIPKLCMGANRDYQVCTYFKFKYDLGGMRIIIKKYVKSRHFLIVALIKSPL